jgi:DNA-binding CsgD family transcriptional regulator/PAS domain-containing protein
MNDEFMGRVIGKIYDCAVDPDGWIDVLTEIRDALDLAYLSLHFMSFPPDYPLRRHVHRVVTTEWDQHWMDEVVRLTPEIPNFDQVVQKEIDEPTTQLRHISEAEFVQSRFYREWVAPQGLRDSCHVNIIRRGNMTSQLIGAIRNSRSLLTDAELRVLGSLTPHMRRALVISDMLDVDRTRMQWLSDLLDQISLGVFLIGSSGKIAYVNEAGTELLASNIFLGGKNQRLTVRSPVHADAFRQAIDKACGGNDADLGHWGNGMALPGADGSTAIVYVLPMGTSEKRHSLGEGLAAVLVTTESTAHPPTVEVLTALSGMTVSESRIALGISEGQSLEQIAVRQGISVNTVRKHLSNAFDKTNARSQVALSAFVNRLKAPLRQPSAISKSPLPQD